MSFAFAFTGFTGSILAVPVPYPLSPVVTLLSSVALYQRVFYRHPSPLITVKRNSSEDILGWPISTTLLRQSPFTPYSTYHLYSERTKAIPAPRTDYNTQYTRSFHPIETLKRKPFEHHPLHYILSLPIPITPSNLRFTTSTTIHQYLSSHTLLLGLL